MSGWQGYLTCKECDAEHDFKTHAYSDGVCPYCGHTGWSSTFTEVHQGIKRWTRTAPWWRFWGEQGFWDFVVGTERWRTYKFGPFPYWVNGDRNAVRNRSNEGLK